MTAIPDTTTRAETEQELRKLVGRRLRMLRGALSIDQRRLAERAGVTRNFVSAIERGERFLDAWRLSLLAETAGVPVAWLLDRCPSVSLPAGFDFQDRP